MAKNSNTYKTFNVNEKTPTGFYNQLNEEFHFDFDPCPLNPSPETDGLTVNWGGALLYQSALWKSHQVLASKGIGRN